MNRRAGGSVKNTLVGAGLTASLFLFGLVVLGTMMLLEQLFGGAGDARRAQGSRKEAA